MVTDFSVEINMHERDFILCVIYIEKISHETDWLPIIFSSYSHVIYCWTLSFYHVWPLKSVRSSIEPSALVVFSLHVFSWYYKEDSALCSFRNERLFWFQNIQMWTCILSIHKNWEHVWMNYDGEKMWMQISCSKDTGQIWRFSMAHTDYIARVLNFFFIFVYFRCIFNPLIEIIFGFCTRYRCHFQYSFMSSTSGSFY